MDDIINYKELTLYPDAFMCFIGDKEVKLTRNEYNLLHFFLTNQNHVFSRREIMDSVWNKKISFNTIDATVSKIQKKISPYRYITTQGSFGYGILDKDVIRERCSELRLKKKENNE